MRTLIPRATLLGLAAVILGGCQYLFGYPYGPYPSDPGPQPSSTYTTGRATITIGSERAIVLDTLVEGGAIDPEFGVGATFRNDDGWYVRLMGVTKATDAYASYITLERIVDHRHWTTFDPSGCTYKIAGADASGLSGTATCKRLRWSDAMAAGVGSGYQPPYIEGQDPFDAVITFEAAPATSSSSGAPASTQPG